MYKNIYLDNAATTPILPEVKKYVISLLDKDKFYNPSSIYRGGQKLKQIINQARLSVSQFINADLNKSDILFTSGGSASNTLGIAGYYRKHGCTLLYSPTMHKSALKCIVDYSNSYQLKVNEYGFIDIDDLKEWLDARQVNPFVVLEYANSEIGTIQNVKEIINLVHFYNGIVYLDCTASISTIPLDVNDLNVDIVGFSGHKLGALKGIGVLYKKKNIALSSIIYGSQEDGLFAGTENILGIASIGKACDFHDYFTVSSRSRDYIYNFIRDNISESIFVGPTISSGKRLKHNLYYLFPGIEGESLLMLLDTNGIQTSTGSACTSGDMQPSSTLVAIGVDKKNIHSGIRMTFSGNETEEELNYICKTLKCCTEQLRSLL